MSGFDQPGVYYSDSLGVEPLADEGQLKRSQIKRHFKEFLRQYRTGTDRTGFTYKYRDELKRHYTLGEFWIEVEMEDLASFNEDLADCLLKQPSEHLPLVRDLGLSVCVRVLLKRQCVMFQGFALPVRGGGGECYLHTKRSEQMSRLVKIPGIVIAASAVRAKATKIALQCRSCRNVVGNIAVRPGLEGYALPRKCNTEQAGRPKCPVDPYFIVPDKCKCVDFQLLKLQESPDAVPHGEMPRHMQLYCDRYLCDKVVPGNRVTIIGIYSIKKAGKTSSKGRDRVGVGIRSSYIRVVGIQIDTEGSAASLSGAVTSGFLAPSPCLGHPNNTIGYVCSKLFARSVEGGNVTLHNVTFKPHFGSVGRLPDGLTRRGDINLLMLGDPGTAKSQLLKFVERCSPIGVRVSGYGTVICFFDIKVLLNNVKNNLLMIGGSRMFSAVLVVRTQEFSSMREDDRVAIHEAMEQQTISIAKAGITTTLNSRCSVLAAANSVFGRWDDTKGEENIDFMPTILSRFDMIFIVKDEHDEERDMTLARHVMNVHLSALTQTQAVEGEIDLNKLKKYIAYCRAWCGLCWYNNLSLSPPPRQLEAIVRISEALSKMKFQPFATEADVEEALRLFQVSTLDAALSGNLSGKSG
uniref:DNA replication licensing factor MCM5 n=1 Tax=Latimeria chalumnae TaxID=7897 RepID=H3A8U4_LATCH